MRPAHTHATRRHPIGAEAHTDSVTPLPVDKRRRAGTPPQPPENATCTCRIVIPTFNAEFVPERDAGPCTRPAVARLSIRHDGTERGCHGQCQLPDADRPDPAHAGSADRMSRRPWVQVVLLCRSHAVEHTAAITAVDSPATTFEELT